MCNFAKFVILFYLSPSLAIDFPCAYYSGDCQACLAEERSALCTFLYTIEDGGDTNRTAQYRCADRDAVSATMLKGRFAVHVNAPEFCGSVLHTSYSFEDDLTVPVGFVGQQRIS